MYAVLTFINLAVQILLWSLLVGFGAWLYKRFRLRALPWLGAYLAVSLLVGLATHRVLRALLDGGSAPAHLAVGEFLTLLAGWVTVFQGLTRLVLAILILAEITSLVARAAPAFDLRPF